MVPRAGTRRTINIDIPGAPIGLCQGLQSTFERAAAACGCREGAMGVALAVTSTVAFFSLEESGISRSSEVWIGVALALCGALVGKFFGLLRVHRHLRKSVHEFIAVARPHSS
jgi:hypothetical protein